MRVTEPDPTADKVEWRAWARQVGEGIDWARASGRIVESLGAWEPVQTAAVILTYLPMAAEVSLVDLIDLAPDHRWCTTRTPRKGYALSIHELGGPLERHPYGYMQPAASAPEVPAASVDVALVPGLAFDRTGGRIGHGAGYYDRLLPALRPDACLVGVVPSELVVGRLPTDEHDVPMSHLATEDRVIATAVAGGRDELPGATRRFLERVAGTDVGIDPVVFPEETRTSQQAAAALGCTVAEITKSLVFMADSDAVMVLMAGDQRVDTDRVAKTVGAQRVRRATLDEVREHSGYAPGGTPPFGHVKELRVLADRSITGNDVVWVAAGSPNSVFSIRVDDLVRLSDATWVDVAEEG